MICLLQILQRCLQHLLILKLPGTPRKKSWATGESNESKHFSMKSNRETLLSLLKTLRKTQEKQNCTYNHHPEKMATCILLIQIRFVTGTPIQSPLNKLKTRAFKKSVKKVTPRQAYTSSFDYIGLFYNTTDLFPCLYTLLRLS